LNTDSAIQASARVFADTPVDVWRSCLLFHWIQNHVDYLPVAYRQARFDLNTRLGGPQTQRSRQSRATQFVNDNLADLVGRAYVDRYFPNGYRERMNEIVRYLKRSFAERIGAANWLDAPTRMAALEKLTAMSVLVGYSDKMRDYAEVEIAPDDPVGNVHRLQAADWAFQRSHLNAATSEWGWNVPPQRVDATYGPQLNRVVFPAGILQAPAFDPCADPAVNFGAIAAVIAHEIGHGFDDQGSQFDARGRLRDWWTPSTRAEFERRTRLLATQFAAYSPVDGVHLDGDVSLGENIADLTGVSIALQAYHLYLGEHGKDSLPVRDGFTGDQRFFLAWAQFWRAIEPEDWLRQAAHESHAPPRYRVNSVVRNMDAWYDAFHVEAYDALYLAPRERVRIW
jgi:putative endopeptidase